MMNRREFLAGSLATAKAAGRDRPNIVLMLADDLGFSDLGCYGSEIATPNLNRLADRGVRFTQMYNCARCCPTRSSLMTGLYPHQTGVGHMMEDLGLPGYRGDLNKECVTIAEALRPAGYRTAISGKWHVTPVGESKHNWPLQRGFEKFYGIIHGGASFFDPVTLAEGNQPLKITDPGYYFTDALTSKALGYMDEFTSSRKPFFLYLPFTSPHYPLHAPEAYIDKYKGRYDAGWDQLRESRYRKQVELGIIDPRWPLAPRETRVPAWVDAKNKPWQLRRMEVYAGMIDNLDQNVGRVLDRLKHHGIERNTLVIFLSDNGGEAQELRASTGRRPIHVPLQTLDGRPVQEGNNPRHMPGGPETFQSIGAEWAHASNTPFRLYKKWAHEGGIATPMIAAWPGRIKQGTITRQTGHVMDLMPTVLDVAGATYPKTYEGRRILPLEGRSLLPVLEGRQRQGHEAIFWEHEGNRAVRMGRWKLVSQGQDRWELYDVEADRTEQRDLAAAHPDRAAEMKASWENWASRVGAVSPKRFTELRSAAAARGSQ
jgi:arylsulfatase A-like enzyme